MSRSDLEELLVACLVMVMAINLYLTWSPEPWNRWEWFQAGAIAGAMGYAFDPWLPRR